MESGNFLAICPNPPPSLVTIVEIVRFSSYNHPIKCRCINKITPYIASQKKSFLKSSLRFLRTTTCNLFILNTKSIWLNQLKKKTAHYILTPDYLQITIRPLYDGQSLV